jgi:hypothetical protein
MEITSQSNDVHSKLIGRVAGKRCPDVSHKYSTTFFDSTASDAKTHNNAARAEKWSRDQQPVNCGSGPSTIFRKNSAPSAVSSSGSRLPRRWRKQTSGSSRR